MRVVVFNLQGPTIISTSQATSSTRNAGKMYAFLGDILLDFQQYSQANHFYQKAAAKGNVSATFNIAILHLNGVGVSRDYSIALYWFRKSAIQGRDRGKLWVSFLTSVPFA